MFFTSCCVIELPPVVVAPPESRSPACSSPARASPRRFTPSFDQKLKSSVEMVAAMRYGEMSSSFTGCRSPDRSSTYSYSSLPCRSKICAPPDGWLAITSLGDCSPFA